MSDDHQFEQMNEVVRRHNPGRRGVITGLTREKAGDIHYQVLFFDSKKEYVPHYELERVEESQDVDKIIREGNYGNVSDLRRNLSHIQISGNLSSLIYSLDITGTEFLPYQFKPVLTFLESPSRGLLIADEVGLGKTIEAGLIWTELRARYDCRRLLVVCPKVLTEKWRDELWKRFGVDAHIMGARELLAELKLPRSRIFDGKGIICSMQSIRLPSDQKREQDPSSPRSQLAQFLYAQSEPIIDLVVIDEAHHMRNSGSQSARLGRALRDVSENVLLLSATPINLKSEDLFNLLGVVDQDLFRDQEFFDQVLQANEPLVRAREQILDENVPASRIREYLIESRDSEHGVLANNAQLKKLIETLKSTQSVSTIADRVKLANKIERVNFLCNAVSRTRRREVTELRVTRKPHRICVKPNMAEQEFYSDVTASIKDYAQQRGISDGFLLANPQRQVSSCMYAAAKSWRDRVYPDILDEDVEDGIDLADEMPPLINHLASTVLPSVSLSNLRDEDSKFDAFYGTVQTYWTEHPDSKIVVFSYFLATLDYLAERLEEKGIASQILVGGAKESKQDAIDRFRDTPETKMLLSSEVVSEGVDLQFCRTLINYDLPWNPMKIEQRIGRLDRIGQKSKEINISNLFHANTIDERIYDRLFERLKVFERALGGMEAMLGEKIRELTDVLICHPEDEQKRIEQTRRAIENMRHQEEQLENQASSLLAHSDYILNKVRTAQNLKKRITEDDLKIYVKDYLDKHAPGHEFRQDGSKENLFYIRLPAEAAVALADYIKAKNLHASTGLAMGDRVLCRFINKIDKQNVGDGARERINQFHPLIRFISTKVGDEDFFPVVAVKLRFDSNIDELGLPYEQGQYAFVVEKWVFSGLHEETDMRVRMAHVERDINLSTEDSWKLLNAIRLDGSDWPEYTTQVNRELLAAKISECEDYLRSEFEADAADRKTENEDRINAQIHSAEQRFDRQIATRNGMIEKYRSENKTRMIPAIEGQIDKLKRRVDVRIHDLKRRVDIQASQQYICCGTLLLLK